LKKAYEEKGKIAVTKPAATPTTAVTARPQNRYVLVLVDGNNYIVSFIKASQIAS
jgi:predicted AlkP superfamily pyrophosphatase or phosphodiesterase